MSPPLGKRSKRDVIVVGAGLSGLTAASELSKAGASVVVLEARDRVGGRTLTAEHEGFRYDLGGQWLGPTQHRMKALTERFEVATFPTYAAGRQLLVDGAKSVAYSGTIPKISPLALLSLQAALSTLERHARQIDTAKPWASRKSASRDRVTIGAWLVSHVPNPTARAILTTALRVIFGAEPDEVSLLYLSTFARSAGSLMELVEVEGGAQETRFVLGAQEISLRLAETLGDDVVTSTPVAAVRVTPDGVETTTPLGRWGAERMIFAVAPALRHRIAFDPPLPAGHASHAGLAQRAAMGSTIKCHVFYDRPFWRHLGLSGEIVFTDGPVSVAFDNSAHDGSVGALTVFVVARAAYELARMSKAEREAAVVAALTRALGPEAQSHTFYNDLDWGSEMWSGGCPTGFLPPGALTQFGEALREPLGPIHWAGTETSDVWPGYMEGAVAAGERAAAEALAALSSQEPAL